jgi:hypothetical protein
VSQVATPGLRTTVTTMVPRENDHRDAEEDQI